MGRCPSPFATPETQVLSKVLPGSPRQLQAMVRVPVPFYKRTVTVDEGSHLPAVAGLTRGRTRPRQRKPAEEPGTGATWPPQPTVSWGQGHRAGNPASLSTVGRSRCCGAQTPGRNSQPGLSPLLRKAGTGHPCRDEEEEGKLAGHRGQRSRCVPSGKWALPATGIPGGPRGGAAAWDPPVQTPHSHPKTTRL